MTTLRLGRPLLPELLFLATALLAPCAARARDFAVATLDRPAGATLAEVMIRRFAQESAVPVTIATWAGGLDALHAHAVDAADAWDVVEIAGGDLQPACDQSLLERIDWTKLGGRDRFLAGGATDCGVGAVVSALVLAWDRDKVQGTPSWADFWDVVKYPGKRGLQRGVRGNLEIALLADGVAPGDVYRTLRTADGVDRAFRKLDQLKPYIVWWQDDAQATKILGSGEVLMTSAPSDRVASARVQDHRNFGMQWTGALDRVAFWAILKADPKLATAYQFLAYAADPKQQARLLSGNFLGGFAKGASDGLPAEVQAVSPALPEHLAAGLGVDDGFWRSNEDKLAARFETWLAAH